MIGEPSKPGQINLQVYDQGVNWWDLDGNRHEISEMCTRYRDAVLNFLRRRADAHALKLDLNNIFMHDISGPTWIPHTPKNWQESTELFRALKERPTSARDRAVDAYRNAQDRVRWELKKRGLR